MDDSDYTRRQLNFEKWRKINELTFSDVSEQSGIPYSTLKSFVTKPGQGMIDRNVEKLTIAYGISADDIFVNPVRMDGPPLAVVTQLPASTQIDGTVEILEYDIKLAAGGGYLIDGENIKNRWRIPTQFITEELRLSPNSLHMVEVVGDSMYPKLLNSDRVLINLDDTNPTPPGVFAMWDGYGRVVKNVQRIHRSEPAKLMLISENPIYPPYEVFLDDIKIVGRVVWCARKM